MLLKQRSVHDSKQSGDPVSVAARSDKAVHRSTWSASLLKFENSVLPALQGRPAAPQPPVGVTKQRLGRRLPPRSCVVEALAPKGGGGGGCSTWDGSARPAGAAGSWPQRRHFSEGLWCAVEGGGEPRRGRRPEEGVRPRGRPPCSPGPCCCGVAPQHPRLRGTKRCE